MYVIMKTGTNYALARTHTQTHILKAKEQEAEIDIESITGIK